MIKIKNWETFQHYRDRNPPWIKLHRKLLNDREFFNLDGNCVKTLVLLWMLAAETKDGELPAIEDIAFRLRLDSKVLACQIAQLKHWLIVDDSDLLADCKQGASELLQNSPPETETETETETERETDTENRERDIVSRTCAHDVGDTVDMCFDLFWAAYPKKVGRKAASKAFRVARKSGCPEIGAMIAAIEKQRKSDQWRRDGGQYIPNPTTWLNQGRWDDSIQGSVSVHDELREWAEEKEAQLEAERNSEMLFSDKRMLSGPVQNFDRSNRWKNNDG